MRVLNIMLGGKKGGLEQAAVSYAEALRLQGHDVTTVIRRGAAITGMLHAGGFKVLPVSLPHRWNVLAMRRIRRAMRDSDVVILHGNRAADMTAGDKKGLPPVVAVVHSRFFAAAPQMDALIVLTPEMARLQAAGNLPVHIVPNPVTVPDAVSRAPLRLVPVIGAMGRLSEEKGMDIFIDAIALLRARGFMVEGVIGGSGALEDALRARAASHPSLGGKAVRFAGWVADKKEFFAGIDIFCLTSRTETFALTLAEAMAHGVPSVATRCGGPAEIIEDGVNGRLAAIDAEAVAAALQALLSDAAETARLAEAGRASVAARYSLPVIGARLDAVLKSVLKA